MNDRFKFRAIVKGYYYNDTPEKYEEFEPKIFLENVDILDGDVGIQEDELEIAIRKQFPEIADADIEYMLEVFRDNSTGLDTYVTITPEIIQQCTGMKDKNGKLIYEGDIVKDKRSGSVAIIEYNSYTYSLMAHIRGMDDYIPLEDICYLGSDDTPFEVIGNIYENPELLEGK